MSHRGRYIPQNLSEYRCPERIVHIEHVLIRFDPVLRRVRLKDVDGREIPVTRPALADNGQRYAAAFPRKVNSNDTLEPEMRGDQQSPTFAASQIHEHAAGWEVARPRQNRRARAGVGT
jgi:hypothetical protein